MRSSFELNIIPALPSRSATTGVRTTVTTGPSPANSKVSLSYPDPSVCCVYDSQNPCLANFVPSGMLLSSASYPADLQEPTNIELDHLGHLLVADSSNMRVQRFVQPAITLSASVSGSSFNAGAPITVTVVASTTDPSGLKNVSPNAIPVTSVQCGAGSTGALVTTTTPQSYQVGSGPTTVTQPSLPLAAGSTVTFTMVFPAGSGSGGLTFNVGAAGTLVATNVATSQQRTLDSIPINGSGVQQPTSRVTTPPAAPHGVVITDPLTLGWFLGTSATGVHIAGSATTNEIDWSTSDQNNDHLTHDAFQFSCGTSKDLSVSRDGSTQIFYRAVSTSGLTEAWHKVTIERSSGPSIDLGPATLPNANNWYNGAVTVSWSATEVVAGLKQVKWSASTGA